MLVLDLCWLLTCLKYGHLKLAYTHICVSWGVFLILAVAVVLVKKIRRKCMAFTCGSLGDMHAASSNS